MARFSALTLLVTVFYFFVCATQVSTPSHSDTSLRIIKIVPQLYPTLAISAPPPTRSPCAGLNRCSKTPIYGTWASRFVRSVNQARGYLNVRNTIRPYLLRVDRYVHQITEMLGRPTPDSLVGLALMPTTGKAASPLVWARVEKAPAARPPPPPPPTRSLPVYFPPAPTSGPWNPPTPTTGYSRPRHAEPVVEVDSDDWSQQALSIGSTLILVAISFVWRFTKALPSVKCVEHRNSESDGAVPYCGAIRSVVPPTTEPTASQVTQKPTIKPTVENQQSRPKSPLITPPAAYFESTVSETTHRILDVVVWRPRTLVPTPIAPLEPATLIGLSTLASRSQLSVTLSQLSRPDNILNHLDQIHSLLVTAERCVPLLIEWHTTTTEERLEVVSPPAITLIFTNAPTILHRRTSTILNHTFDFLAWTSSEEPRHPRARPVFGHHAPLLIEWNPTRNDVARQLETTYPPSHSETVSTSSFTLVPHTPTTFSPTHAFLRPTPWLPLKIISHEVLRPVTAQDPCARTTNTHDQGVAIGRRTPLLIGRLPEKSAEVSLVYAEIVA
ncbi:hypothetical protein FRC11_006826 [Ceratobasidium sp. 423]|nr:hypothetical protein FRC11_006826 [Ceratobasidium sp. 423]